MQACNGLRGNVDQSTPHSRSPRDKFQRGKRRHKDETHEIAQRKLQQMEKLRGAFGIGTDVNEGDAFNPEVQEAKRQAERDRREAEKQVCHAAIKL